MRIQYRAINWILLTQNKYDNCIKSSILYGTFGHALILMYDSLQDSEQYVDKLLELFNRFSLLVKDAFNDDPRFLTARDKAYKNVVNDVTIFRLELPAKNKG